MAREQQMATTWIPTSRQKRGNHQSRRDHHDHHRRRGGIGLAVGIAIINAGGRVTVLDIDENAAHAAAARLASSGGTTAGCGADVTDPYSLARAFAAAGKALGPIDGLVTCAGIRQTSAPVHSLPHEEWTQVLKVDLFGTFLSCQIAAKMMLEQGSGSIVTIGSTSATLPRLGQAAYCTAKAGVAAFTRVLAL